MRSLLVSNYINRNKDVHNWLYSHGGEPFLVLPAGGLDGPGGGIMYEGQGNGVCETLLKNCEDLGVEIMTSTVATKLVVDENGAVVGALATEDDGDEFYISTKAVFVATGGLESIPTWLVITSVRPARKHLNETSRWVSHMMVTASA